MKNKKIIEIFYITIILLLWKYFFRYTRSIISNLIIKIFLFYKVEVISSFLTEILMILLPALILIVIYKIDLKKDFYIPKLNIILYTSFLTLIFLSLTSIINYFLWFYSPLVSPYFNYMLRILSFRFYNPFTLIFAYALVPAVSEELLFRGFYLNFLDKNKGINAIILSAALFAVFHFEFLIFIQVFLAGILLGYSYKISKSILIPIFLHFSINLMTILAFNFPNINLL